MSYLFLVFLFCNLNFDELEDTLRIKGTNGNKEIEISRKALSEVIEKSLTRIISHCANCVEDNGMLNYMPTGYVLTGGTANLEGVQKLGEDVTKTNFEILNCIF